jgi:hypothetical protein
MSNIFKEDKDREWSESMMDGSWNYVSDIQKGQGYTIFAMKRADDETRRKQFEEYKKNEIVKLEAKIEKIKKMYFW